MLFALVQRCEDPFVGLTLKIATWGEVSSGSGIDCVATPRAEGNRARSQKQSRRHREEREKPRGQERDAEGDT